ncbi:MAG: HIT family protein [Saprospiraceae bacterium]
MPSIFTKIIRGEVPCHKIAEDEHHLAFLDVSPLVKGHTLVVPKREVDYYFDLEDEELAALNAFAKRVATAVFREIPCLRIGTAVIGLEVPHVHMHLVPLNQVSDIDFTKKKLSPSQADLAATAERIRKVFL